MNKSIFAAAACCVVLSGCQTWARTDNGFYSVWLQRPDPKFPNVFVYPASEGRSGYAVIDQDPIVLRAGQNTVVSWAIDATNGYVFKKISFKDAVTGGDHKLAEPCTITKKVLTCPFGGIVPNKLGKLFYTIVVGLPDTKESDIATDPSVWWD